MNDQPPTNEQAGGSIFPIHYPVGNYPGHDYDLYNYPKYPGSMIGRGEEDGERSMSIEMIVRSIPKSMKSRAEALLRGRWFCSCFHIGTPRAIEFEKTKELIVGKIKMKRMVLIPVWF